MCALIHRSPPNGQTTAKSAVLAFATYLLFLTGWLGLHQALASDMSLVVTSGTTMQHPREGHTSTRLPDGRILVIGGSWALDSFLTAVEIYNPVTGISTPVTSLHTSRTRHTATLLPDGRVLVVGGYTLPQQWLADAEVYDPKTDVWTVVAPKFSHGISHSTTLLKNGKVLVAGGAIGNGVCTDHVETFNPMSNAWTEVAPMDSERGAQTAQLLSDGRVLLAGGARCNSPIAPLGGESMVYDPQTNVWASTGHMVLPRFFAESTRLPDGRVLVTGGFSVEAHPNFVAAPVAETYDPVTNTWSAAGSLAVARCTHGMVSMPNGQVLVVGGVRDWGNPPHWTADSFVPEIESYDPSTNQWNTLGLLPNPVAFSTTSLLADGRVWLAGGRSGQNGATRHDDTWLLKFSPEKAANTGSDLLIPRSNHTATRLLDGRVLVVGGARARNTQTNTVEIFNPSTGLTSPVATMHTPRSDHSATLLPDGRVLVVGGYSLPQQWLTDAEVYDPVADTWTVIPPLFAHGNGHTATLLQNGRILVAGGAIGSGVCTQDVETFNPQTNTWTEAAPLASGRYTHSTQLLNDGRVLLTGGWSCNSFPPLGGDAMLYDPVANIWSPTGPMIVQRRYVETARLPDGRVLVAGGYNSVGGLGITNTAEIYNPVSNSWSAAGTLSVPRYLHSLVALPNGRMLAVNGSSDTVYSPTSLVANMESYNPVSNQWTIIGQLQQPNIASTATLLQDGRVWGAGGRTGGSGAEVFWPNTWLMNASYPPGYALSVAINGSGSVTSDVPGIACGTACNTNYTFGDTLTLTAIPASADFSFTGWSGACTGISPSCVVSIDSAKSVQANFVWSHQSWKRPLPRNLR